MLGEVVLEILLEAVLWVVVEVLWRGVKLFAKAVYRLVTVPLSVASAAVLGGDDGSDPADD